MPAFDDFRSGIVACRTVSVPLPARLLFIFTLRSLIAPCLGFRRTGLFLIRCPVSFRLLLSIGLLLLMLLGALAKEHLTQPFDRGFLSLQEFNQNEDSSQQAFYLLFSAWFQIGSANLLNQILDLGGHGFPQIFPSLPSPPPSPPPAHNLF